jgi:hypothetical protein
MRPWQVGRVQPGPLLYLYRPVGQGRLMMQAPAQSAWLWTLFMLGYRPVELHLQVAASAYY